MSRLCRFATGQILTCCITEAKTNLWCRQKNEYRRQSEQGIEYQSSDCDPLKFRTGRHSTTSQTFQCVPLAAGFPRKRTVPCLTKDDSFLTREPTQGPGIWRIVWSTALSQASHSSAAEQSISFPFGVLNLFHRGCFTRNIESGSKS